MANAALVILVAILISLDIKRQLQCTDSSCGIIKRATFARLATATYEAKNELYTMGYNTTRGPVVCRTLRVMFKLIVKC